jgi:hypothetical protein
VPSSLSSCAWLTYNTRTKEHDDKVLSSSSSCPWGPPTFEHKKNRTMSSSSLCPWDLEHWNKKMHNDEEPNSSSSCGSMTRNIGTKEHDDERLSP